MRRWIGWSCVFLGIVSIISAAGFIVYNRIEEAGAEETAQVLLADVRSMIDEAKQEQPLPDDTEKLSGEMATVEVDGYDCIGILSVPALDLKLPVLTQWSYTKLKKAPCLYYGTCYETDFVIAAHNYGSHFGRLSQLEPGDPVIFTDVNGTDHCYEVVLLETLPREAVQEMITSGFALSLYTCTPGGANRVTVRCNATQKIDGAS